ncbi:hypothetical protein ALC53_11304, partial [Atta colombica]
WHTSVPENQLLVLNIDEISIGSERRIRSYELLLMGLMLIRLCYSFEALRLDVFLLNYKESLRYIRLSMIDFGMIGIGIPSHTAGNENDEIRYRLRSRHAKIYYLTKQYQIIVYWIIKCFIPNAPSANGADYVDLTLIDKNLYFKNIVFIVANLTILILASFSCRFQTVDRYGYFLDQLKEMSFRLLCADIESESHFSGVAVDCVCDIYIEEEGRHSTRRH